VITSITVHLPLVSLSQSPQAPPADTAEQIHQALRQRGFMYVQSIGIDASLIAHAFHVAREFFAQPATFKQQFAYTSAAANFGYQGIEAERLDPTHAPDLKEAFTMRNALAQTKSSAAWPGEEFRVTAMKLFTESLAAGQRLLSLIAQGLSLPPDFFTSRHSGENVTLRFLHYPAHLDPRSQTQLGAGAHTDYGSITLLFQDDVGGLEVRDSNDQWQFAAPLADAVVINTGDLMERWTNGRFRSTLHRVRPITGHRDRYSIAVFIDPDSAVVVDSIPSCVTADNPARYPPIAAGDHLQQKITATHRI
jgi:isopenicillin N synthase-like dioxygenase